MTKTAITSITVPMAVESTVMAVLQAILRLQKTVITVFNGDGVLKNSLNGERVIIFWVYKCTTNWLLNSIPFSNETK